MKILGGKLYKFKHYFLGERSLVFEFCKPTILEKQQIIWRCCQTLSQYPEIREVVPGMNNISLIFTKPQKVINKFVNHFTMQCNIKNKKKNHTRCVKIPVRYGGQYGPDLDKLSQQLQLSPQNIIDIHSKKEYTVYFIGFQPGFPYLGGLDQRLHVARRDVPRIKIPSGSVGIGGGQTGVYPYDSPGGWHIIGHTEIKFFDIHANPPTLLCPGFSVKFVSI